MGAYGVTNPGKSQMSVGHTGGTSNSKQLIMNKRLSIRDQIIYENQDEEEEGTHDEPQDNEKPQA